MRFRSFTLLIPSLFFFVLFLVIPVFGSIFYFLFKSENGFTFIALQNILSLLKDPIMHIALLNNLKFILFQLLISLPLGLFLALMLIRIEKLRNFLKTVFILPIAFPLITTGLIFSWMYQPMGPLNFLLGHIGITHNWLGDPNTAVYAVIFTNLWVQLSYNFLFFYTGLLNIPKTYIEAAKIDGATGFKHLRHIILPLLRPAFMLVFFSIILNSLRTFDTVRIMTGGGPYRSSEVLANYFYVESFYTFKFAYGSTIALMLTALSLFIVIPYVLWIIKGEVRYE